MSVELTLPVRPYNLASLTQELKDALPNKIDGVSRSKGVCRAIFMPDAGSEADQIAAVGVANAHDPTVLTAKQELTAAAQKRQQIVDYLKAQLTNANPDVAAVKAHVQTLVNGNAKISTALTNIANLYNDDLNTNAGYLRAALRLIALMT